MHNSNLQLRQIILSSETIEEKFYVLGFVPADVTDLKKDVWFSKLDSEQTSNAEEYFARCAMNFA